MHQVAQKFSRTTLPRSSARVNGWPVNVWNCTWGAGSKLVFAAAVVVVVAGLTLIQPSALGSHAANLELDNRVDWPLITSNPTTISTTPETTSTLCRCLRNFP